MVSKGNTTYHSPDVMEAFYDVTSVCYASWATSCLIMASLIAVVKFVASEENMNIRVYTIRISQVLWSSAETIVDQENLQLKRWPARIGWSVMCLTIFIVTHGFILNLIKTDLAVPMKPKVIDRIGDFFKPEFEHVMPGIFTTHWFFDKLSTEPSDTILGRLYQERMATVQEQNGCHRDGDGDFFRCSIIAINVDDQIQKTVYGYEDLQRQIIAGKKHC